MPFPRTHRFRSDRFPRFLVYVYTPPSPNPPSTPLRRTFHPSSHVHIAPRCAHRSRRVAGWMRKRAFLSLPVQGSDRVCTGRRGKCAHRSRRVAGWMRKQAFLSPPVQGSDRVCTGRRGKACLQVPGSGPVCTGRRGKACLQVPGSGPVCTRRKKRVNLV